LHISLFNSTAVNVAMRCICWRIECLRRRVWK